MFYTNWLNDKYIKSSSPPVFNNTLHNYKLNSLQIEEFPFNNSVFVVTWLTHSLIRPTFILIQVHLQETQIKLTLFWTKEYQHFIFKFVCLRQTSSLSSKNFCSFCVWVFVYLKMYTWVSEKKNWMKRDVPYIYQDKKSKDVVD